VFIGLLVASAMFSRPNVQPAAPREIVTLIAPEPESYALASFEESDKRQRSRRRPRRDSRAEGKTAKTCNAANYRAGDIGSK